jgi:hypothetical protein
VTAHLTAAQARALGIGNTLPIVPARKRTTRRALPRERAVSVCHVCGAVFTSAAAETRHVAETVHARFDCYFGEQSDVAGTPIAYAPGMSDAPITPDPVDTDAPVDPDDDDPDADTV